jgi:acetyltransferase
MLKTFSKPNSIVIIGASREKGKVGRTVFDNLISAKFKGELYLVNPKAEEINGCKCYKNIKDIHNEIDLAIIVIPAKLVPQILIECGEKKIKGAIIISAGFKETGPDGCKLEKQIVKIAEKYNIRILGPNCLGLIDPVNSLNASFATTLPPKGEIAFMSQSGALLTGILDWAVAEKIGFSKLVSLGNRADLSEIDLLKMWSDDPTIKVIIGYLEGVKRWKGIC